MNPIKIALFTHQKLTTALEYLRIIGPISFTKNKIFRSAENNEDVYNYIKQANLVVIQRDFPADFNFYNDIYKISRELKKPLVYDLDDNLFILPENHPDRKSSIYSRALIPMLQAAFDADFLTVTSESFKRELEDVNPNIFILPNFLDDQIWQLLPPKEPLAEKPLTIGYMGGDSHKPDLEFIAPTLCEIKDKYSEKIRYYFYGVKPPDSILAYKDTVWESVKTYQYNEFAKDFQQTNVDLLIAPLINNKFNQCKSAIKFFEYSSLGIPGIYSRIFPYEQIIVDGENALLAESLQEWSKKIQLLINNPDLGYQIAINAQRTVKDNYLMSENSDIWTKTYNQIIKTGVTKENPNSELQHLVRCITEQMGEYYEYCDKKEQELQKEIEYQKQDNQSLKIEVKTQKQLIQELQKEVEIHKTEILYYALSKSWNITRPLRKIAGFFKGNRS